MTDAELEAADNIIGAATTNIYERVFFLGPYARRVSFSSMQNRALNLVWALQGRDRIAKGDHVAVIGGGLSGVTATAALIELGYTVTIYEDGENVMHRQSSAAHRYIHPTVNRWPEKPVEETTAVPYFDWVSALCSDVVGKVREEWKLVSESPAVTFVPHVSVDGFTETDGRVGVRTATPCSTRGERYQIVLVTSGFAEENYGNRRLFPGYWKPDGLEADLAAPENKDAKYLISGCGDGGLIDALRVAHTTFDWGKLVVDVARELFDAGWPGLKVIADAEDALARNGAEMKKAIAEGSDDLKRAYVKAAKMLPKDLAKRLITSLRLDRGVEFVTLVSREKNPFSPMSAPIHKLLVAHAMIEMTIVHRCCVVAGTAEDHLMVAPCGTKREDVDSAPKTRIPGRVILRHGAQPNFSKFFGTDTDAAEDLIARQKMLAANLDRRFWSEGAARLKTWPPEKGFALDLKKREKAAVDLIRRLTNMANGIIDVDDDDGFLFYHTYGDAPAVAAARLPEKLFGFKLKVIVEDEMEMADADATGATMNDATFDDADGVVRPGAAIVGGLNGRLGPICVDGSGRLFAITARHLAPAGRFWTIPVNDSNRIAVGSFVDEAGEASDLALISLNADRVVTPEYAGNGSIKGSIDAHEAFGRDVYLERPGGGRTVGYVSATRVGATFRHPGSDHRVELRNLVRIRSADPLASFAAVGDSGAPVVSDDGRLLGIVVCNDAAYTYVLSCQRFMAERGLRLLETAEAPRSATPIDDVSEIDALANMLGLYATANRRDQAHRPLDLGSPPQDVEADGVLESQD